MDESFNGGLIVVTDGRGERSGGKSDAHHEYQIKGIDVTTLAAHCE